MAFFVRLLILVWPISIFTSVHSKLIDNVVISVIVFKISIAFRCLKWHENNLIINFKNTDGYLCMYVASLIWYDPMLVPAVIFRIATWKRLYWRQFITFSSLNYLKRMILRLYWRPETATNTDFLQPTNGPPLRISKKKRDGYGNWQFSGKKSVGSGIWLEKNWVGWVTRNIHGFVLP